MNGVLSSFVDWAKQPYSENMDVLGWFLFIGLLLLIMVAWRAVINKIA